MKKKSSNAAKVVVPGGVDEYIEASPQAVRAKLRDIRAAIQSAAPRSSETVSYFQMPGYYFEGYDYNGMFAWFSYKKPFIRLHVRPPVLEEHGEEISAYTKTKAIVSFPDDESIPKTLVKKLVKASINVMRQKPA